MAKSLLMFIVIAKDYPINMKYVMVMSLAKLNLKSIHYRYKLNVKVHLLTIVYRLQYPMSLSRAGISLLLDVVIKSSNSEMSLRSKVL